MAPKAALMKMQLTRLCTPLMSDASRAMPNQMVPKSRFSIVSATRRPKLRPTLRS